MYVVFNIVIIGLVLLIAYWWANQGVFSAILHLVCVVVAGAVAFGVWEQLVVNVFLSGGGFDNYVWGVTLIGVFAVVLLILRIATDKLAPANVDIPHWANLVFGFPVGAAAGVITMGVVVIGCGMMQSTGEIMGYRGYGRNQRGEVTKFGPMWVPVHEATAGFYGWLSVTTMWSNQPMRQYYPKLHWQASLMRDSWGDGKGQLALSPDAARVRKNWQDTQSNSFAVEMQFDSGAMDFGERLTLSSAQVRLLGDARGRRSAPVHHPNRWIQGGTLYLFDDVSHYATSVPGQESATLTFIFDRLPQGFVPRFVQVRGVRFRLPNPEAMPPGLLAGVSPTGAAGGAVTQFDGTARPIPESEIKLTNDIRPVRAGKNSLPAGIDEVDGFLTEGFGTFRRGGVQIARSLQIKGISEPPGTRILWLDVSRGAVCDVFGQGLRAQVGENAEMKLVDATGNSYSAIGYIHEKGDDSTDIKLEPSTRIKRLDQLPYLPTSGTQRLRLYFRVTDGATLAAFVVGDQTLGTTQVRATDS